MERTLSFKTTDDVAAWLDSRPEGRSAYLRQLVDRARQAEIDAQDLAIVAELDGDIVDVAPEIDPDEWARAAAEWNETDL